MDKIYSKEFEIHFYEINRYKEATPIAILNYLEETAGCHSEDVGCGLDQLKESGVAWILNRWNLVMDRYPVWNDRIVVETWSSGLDRFYANREFLLKDQTGRIIGKASSLWIYLNMEKKRPVRIPAEFGDIYGVNSKKVMDTPFEDFSLAGTLEYEKEFFVRKCDIDTNNHVNNARYLEWLLEAVPEEVYDSHRLHQLEIIYKKEATYGATIKSNRSTMKNEMDKKIYTHSISSAKDEFDHALARTTWKAI